MISVKRYVLIPVGEVTAEMRLNTILYGINTEPIIVEISSIDYEVLKWRGEKPLDLWNEYPVYSNEELVDYIRANATLPSPPTPV